jgi:AcrR family transcriptional regulator
MFDAAVKIGSNESMAGVRQFDTSQTVERALEVFWRKGFAATSMQDLADATGVLRGSLYNAYKDKETLFLAAYERYGDMLLEEARQALDKPSPERALRTFFEYTIRSMTTGTPTRGCLTTKTATEESGHGELVHAALISLLDRFEQLVKERLSREDAVQRLALPPTDAARLVVTLTRGIVVMERVYQNPARLKKTADSMIRALFPKRS